MELFFPFLLIWLLQRGGDLSHWDGKKKPKTPKAPPPIVPRTDPWPQVIPAGLPKFPGSLWEYDSPPPPAVIARAKALLPILWARGLKSFKIEKTDHRWITYRAERTKGGKKGVVAFRLKVTVHQPVPAPPVTASRPIPSVPVLTPGVVTNVTHRSPGWPQAKPVSTSKPDIVLPPMVIDVPRRRPDPNKLPILKYGKGLKPRAPHAEVKRLQKLLGLKVDGRFGRGTRDAVNAYQRKHGMRPDGSVGRNTWALLLAGK